ncbi:MAG TPA: hypothetical protein PLS31_00125, partial [Candidatus Sumerlaeota bacterium]|nr:hypothetical protein [Candidatus Sumerlaeota bacterium]
MKKKLFVILFSLMAINLINADETPINQPPALSKMKADISSNLESIDKYLAEAARNLSAADLKEKDIRQILNDFCKKDPAVYDCAFVDINGIMTMIEPKDFKSHEGVDISSQPHVIRLRAKGAPVLSEVFRSA